MKTSLLAATNPAMPKTRAHQRQARPRVPGDTSSQSNMRAAQGMSTAESPKTVIDIQGCIVNPAACWSPT
jgi:hypothetical protein